ncbi:MAG TPA: hypothetical protein VG097_05100, partial [Gemmata sp.]|nr:hypothetical protein [Gemmata sp.]
MTRTTDDPHDLHKSDETVPLSRERQTELEERIHKLETTLAERSNPVLTEDVLADRVIAKLSAAAGLSQPPDGSERVLVLASSHDDLPPPPKGAVLHPPEAATDPNNRTWFLTQLLAEIRLALHMYFDPRYRISRTTQFALPGIAILIMVNYFLFASLINIPILSPIAERALDV